MDLGRIEEFSPRTVDDERRDAGVLIPIVERDGRLYLLFTKRSEDLGNHPGQMSFPGGGYETGDADIRETALREAYEEIGLLEEEADLVGQLDDIRTITEYAVTPFVARVPDREYHPDEREVAEVALLAVDALTDPENYRHERRDHPHYGDIVIHYFTVDGFTVWGATARILVQLLELTTDWRAPERINRRV